MSGGSEVMRALPSTMWVSLPKAWALSRVRALAADCDQRSRARALSSPAKWVFTHSSSNCVYQTGRLPISAKRRIHSR